MNYLKNSNCYLSAPIESDNGPNWRPMVKDSLSKQFGINVFDPFDDPKQQKWEDLKDAKANRDYNKIAKIAKRFVRKDLAMVDRSDFLIAYVPHQICTTGVCHEVINSNNAKKPTLLVTNLNDISYIPIWYYGFIPVEFMFSNWQMLYNYLKEVNDGKHKNNDRWSVIYGEV